MRVVRRPFPSKLLVFPNSKYGFGPPGVTDRPMRIARCFEYPGVGNVYLTMIGAIGFDFDRDGELASIDAFDFGGSGTISDEIMANRDTLISLQQRRQIFMNFIGAALFGRISACAHRSLDGAAYCTLDQVFSFGISGDELCAERHLELEARIAAKLRLFQGPSDHYCISVPSVEDAIAFIDELSRREKMFEYADLRACMVMNYQAAILHAQQQAAASLALNVSVMETLVAEVFLSYGLVGTRDPKPFCRRDHAVAKISNNRFGQMTLYDRLEALGTGRLIDDYLHQRAERARLLRNELMHKGQIVTPAASGECQTVLRDIWALLVEAPFELNAGWTYRI
jgi:hypothetical protein